MAKFSGRESDVLKKIQKRKKDKDDLQGLIPFASGFGPEITGESEGKVPLREGFEPQENISRQPKLIKKSIEKDANKASRAIDSLQEGITGKKTTSKTKMSESMKSAFIAGIPLLIGGLLGGEAGLEAGVAGAEAGLKHQKDRLGAKAKAEESQAEIESKEGIEAEKILVQRERLEFDREKQAAKASEGLDLTESQSKSRIFGTRAAQAEREFESLLGNFDPTDASSALVSNLPNALQSEERQRFEQGKNNFLLAILRKESGARISDEEIAVGDLQYFPRFGDSPGVVSQKARNRKLVTDLLLQEGKVDLNDPRIQRNFTKTTTLQKIQAIKQRRGL